MKIWCVANQKGGVGKTTTSVMLAGLLADSGQRVLAVDLDPHSSMSLWLKPDSASLVHGVADLFAEHSLPVMQLVQHQVANNIDLLPAQAALATVERQGMNKAGLGLALSKGLNALAGHYDYAVLDCPPTLGVLMVSALACADEVIAPTLTEPLALHGLAGLMRTAQMIGRSRSKPLSVRIVPTLYDKRTRVAQDTLRELRDLYTQAVWAEEIPVDTRLREASQSGKPYLNSEPLSRGVIAYSRLLNWLRNETVAQVELAA
jgi:chromosome partitioning protein